jgi:ubiquitin-protein ligase
MTGDLSDNGAQAIQAWHLTFTSRNQTNYNSGIWSLKSVRESLK